MGKPHASIKFMFIYFNPQQVLCLGRKIRTNREAIAFCRSVFSNELRSSVEASMREKWAILLSRWRAVSNKFSHTWLRCALRRVVVRRSECSGWQSSARGESVTPIAMTLNALYFVLQMAFRIRPGVFFDRIIV